MEASTTESALDTVKRFQDLSMAGDIDGARRLLADDLVVHEAPGLPYGGDYHGPDGFFALFAKITQSLTLEPRSVELLEAGDLVVAVVVLGFTSQASGKTVDMDIVELFTVNDGQIVDLDIYYKEPEAIVELMA